MCWYVHTRVEWAYLTKVLLAALKDGEMIHPPRFRLQDTISCLEVSALDLPKGSFSCLLAMVRSWTPRWTAVLP